ncbi:hypothetical protein EPN90_01960 [Patescibacteria group bacterium]|nr:MAG: hypothetical protein EPN90_01960 [Patescibacteria group bacterium]
MKRIALLILAVILIAWPQAAFAAAGEETRLAQVKAGQPLLSAKKQQGFLEANGLTNDDFWAVMSLKENRDKIGIYCSAVETDAPVEAPRDDNPYGPRMRTLKGGFRCLGATPAAAPGTLLALPKGREALRQEGQALKRDLASAKSEADTAKGAATEASRRADQHWQALGECNRARADEDRQTLLKSSMIPLPVGLGGGLLLLTALGFVGGFYRREQQRRDNAVADARVARAFAAGQEELREAFFQVIRRESLELDLRDRALMNREAEIGDKNAGLLKREREVKKAEAELAGEKAALESGVRNLTQERDIFESQKPEVMAAAAENGYADGFNTGKLEAERQAESALNEARTEAGRVIRAAMDERVQILQRTETEKNSLLEDGQRERAAAEADRHKAAALLVSMVEREAAVAAKEGELATRELGLNERQAKIKEKEKELLDETVRLGDAMSAVAADRDKLAEERVRFGQDCLALADEKERLQRTERAVQSQIIAAMQNAPPSSRGLGPFAPTPSTRGEDEGAEPPRQGSEPCKNGSGEAPPAVSLPLPPRPLSPLPPPVSGQVPPSAANTRLPGEGQEVEIRGADDEPAPATTLGVAPPAPGTRRPPDASGESDGRDTAPGLQPVKQRAAAVKAEEAAPAPPDRIEPEPEPLEDAFEEVPDEGDSSDALIYCRHCDEVIDKGARERHRHVRCPICPGAPILLEQDYPEHTAAHGRGENAKAG